MVTYNLGFIMGCCVSMGHASPLDSKKYQYRAVKSPHSKGNARTIFLNKNPFFKNVFSVACGNMGKSKEKCAEDARK